MICLTISRTLQSNSTLSFKAIKYSCSLFGCSKANLAKLTVDTFTEPTLRAVPPILLKSIFSIFSYSLDHFLYAYAQTYISKDVSIVSVLLLARMASTD